MIWELSLIDRNLKTTYRTCRLFQPVIWLILQCLEIWQIVCPTGGVCLESLLIYEWLLSRYRFPRQILLDLCCDLSPLLEHETKRTKAIPVHIQVLSTLEFLATSTFQGEVGDRFNVSLECKYRQTDKWLAFGFICRCSLTSFEHLK